MTDLSSVKCVDYLSEIIDLLKSSNQHERVFHLIIDRIERLFKCQTCAIVLIDPTSEYLSIQNSIGLSHTFCKEFRKKFATGRVGELLWTGRPILVEESDQLSDADRDIMLEHPFASCVCVQIAATHRALGYLHVDAKEQRLFKQEDVKMLQLFADLAAVALYKSQLFEENLHLDRIDHETGLLKYEPFVEMMRETLDKAKDTNEQLSVLILDVDNYKQIVNTYGYDASKEFLKELGQLTKDAMRSIDVGGRYGRDEMIVMLPHTTPDGAVAVAKALRQKVDERSFTNREIRSTISIGVAAYPQNGSGLEDLLMAGREALFEAQRAGRNKVYHYLTEWSSKERILDKG